MAAHLLGAVQGQVLDADGTVILDSFAAWGLSQQTLNFALDVDSTNVLGLGIAAQRMSEDALYGDAPDGYIGLASAGFMDQLRAHPAYAKTLQFARPSAQMADYRSGIMVGDTMFVELRATAGSFVKIPDNTAYLVPRVPGLIIRRFGPADWNRTVNTVGIPFYMQGEPLPMDKGYALEAQTNPFTLVTKPRAIIKLTASA